MSRVIHFELNAEDPQRAVKFYTSVFGWKIETWEGGPEYYLASTGPESEPGINGAINPAPGRGPLTVNTIDISNLEESMEKVKAEGGRILSGPTVVPGVGRMAYCLDTEGNKFGIMQTDTSAGM